MLGSTDSPTGDAVGGWHPLRHIERIGLNSDQRQICSLMHDRRPPRQYDSMKCLFQQTRWALGKEPQRGWSITISIVWLPGGTAARVSVQEWISFILAVASET
jgi:hypothetical protein